jgi:hypothetical protein
VCGIAASDLLLLQRRRHGMLQRLDEMSGAATHSFAFSFQVRDDTGIEY